MKYTYNKNCYDYPQLASYDNAPVELNSSFCVAVALQYINENLATDFPQIKLVATVSAGYNDYMLLHIPADTDFANLDYTQNFDINDADTCTKLDDTTYAFYAYFPEISANLSTELFADDFPN